MQFVGTFMVWIVAEHLGLSGILTIVVYAMVLARYAPARTSARLRVPTYAVWETVVFVLNVLAFILIGMQIRPIWSRLDDDGALALLRNRGAAFSSPSSWRASPGSRSYRISLWLVRSPWIGLRDGQSLAMPSFKSGIVVAWCGMRGIVTLATAFALPENFPYRDLILFTAFAVVLGSLVIQGVTLAAA